MRYRRFRIEGASYFFTLLTEARRPLLASPAAAALLGKAQFQVRSRHPFEIEAEVILPDHVHMIWQLPEGDAAFERRLRLVKSTFTRLYLKESPAPPRSASRQSKGEQAIWQRRYWEHVIRDEDDFGAHLDYIHYNPVAHGLAAAPRDWPFSTFGRWVERGVYLPEWGSDAPPKLPPWAGKE